MNFERLVNLCLDRGVSFWKVEKDLHIANGTLRLWRNSSPRVKNLIKVADYFGVTLDYLAREGT